MKEDLEIYCNLEISKLIKEKNLKPTAHRYGIFCNGIFNYIERNITKISQNELGDGKIEVIDAYTQQGILKWINEKYNIFIHPCVVESTSVNMSNNYYFFRIYKNRKTLDPLEYYKGLKATPEEALDEGIKYTLQNLIK